MGGVVKEGGGDTGVIAGDSVVSVLSISSVKVSMAVSITVSVDSSVVDIAASVVPISLVSVVSVVSESGL